jgi:hypothetical protein
MAIEIYKIILKVEGEKELFSLRWDFVRMEIELMWSAIQLKRLNYG